MKRLGWVVFAFACRSQHAAVGHDPVATVGVVEASTPPPASVATQPPPTPAPPWPDAKRMTSADRSFSLLYPKGTFAKTSAHGDAIDLVSDVSEPNWGQSGGAPFIYSISLTKLHTTPFAALSTVIDSTSYKAAFPSGTEASFVTSPGYIERETGGYRVTMGVEGTGDDVHVFTTPDGASWKLDCNFCCGLVGGKPKLTRDEQIALCQAVIEQFESEHPK